MTLSLPFSPRKFTVKISEENMVFLKQILKAIPQSEIRKKQEYMKTVYHNFLFNLEVKPGE